MKKSLLIAAIALTTGITANVFAQTSPTQTPATTQPPVTPPTTTGTSTAPATPVPQQTAPGETNPGSTVKMVTDSSAADVVGALNSNADYKTAALAVKTANLESTLKSGGPYTIFAPNDAAFSKLPPADLDAIMKDQAKLTTLLKGHIVTGKYDKAELIKALTAGKGKATLTTIDGRSLTLSVSPKKTLQITSAGGDVTEVSLYDLIGNNGIVNGVNAVLTK